VSGPSGSGGVSELIGDAARFTAEEFGEQRVDTGEAAFAGRLEGGERRIPGRYGGKRG
jgi:hypothetical protein